jgi:hypothetical protein
MIIGIGIGIPISQNLTGSYNPDIVFDNIELEDGDDLLLESGDFILLEQ